MLPCPLHTVYSTIKMNIQGSDLNQLCTSLLLRHLSCHLFLLIAVYAHSIELQSRKGSIHAGPFLVHFIVCLEKAGAFTLKKLECSTQASRLNKLAWNNRTRPRFCSVGFWNTR